MPKISIIVPVYNVEMYIHHCIDSILSQTYTDFELILVDDGSPDNCGNICDAYAQKDSRIRVIHQENSGLSAARNAGMEIANGEYILFCDSDDYVTPRWCETLITAASKELQSYIFGGIQKVIPKKSEVAESLVPSERTECFPIEDFLKFHSESIIGYGCNVLFDANIIRSYHLRFRTDVIIEDLPFCLEYLKHMRSLTYCGHAGYYYVQRDASTLSRKYYQDGFRKWKEKYAAIQKFIDECIDSEMQDSCRKLTADYYLFFFLSSLNNTFDRRNNWTLWKKIQYNNTVTHSQEFRHCLAYADTTQENQWYITLLRNQHYLYPYIFARCATVKRKLTTRRTNI